MLLAVVALLRLPLAGVSKIFQHLELHRNHWCKPAARKLSLTTVRQHLGNLRLGSLVDERLATYAVAGAKDRAKLIEEVINQILSEGGRFLKQDGPGMPWLEADRPQAKEKILQSFRSRAKLFSSNSESQGGSNSDTRSGRRTFYEYGETDSIAGSSQDTSFNTKVAESGDAKRQRQ
jgi:hypothetical protein